MHTPSLGTVGELTSNDPSYQLPPTVVSIPAFYVGSLYAISGRESHGNLRRYNEQDDMEDAQVFKTDFGSICHQAFLGVYDGHGSPEVSTWCKDHLHEYLLSRLTAGGDIEKILHETFFDVGKTLKTLPFRDKGTTAAVVLFRLEDTKRVLYSANVGDTKILLCRAGRAVELGRVHNLSDLGEKKRLEKLVPPGKLSQVFTSYQGERVLGFNVTRALGNHYMLAEYNVDDFLISEPHTSRTVLQDDDEFIILASDGVWNRVTDQELITHVSSGLASGLILPQITEDLIRFVRERQQSATGMVFDDATVLIMRFSVSTIVV